MTPEGKVKARIKGYLDTLGADCWYFLPMMMGYGRKGIPDIIGCYCGIGFVIEVKADLDMNDPTAWQARELEAFSRAGGIAILADSADQVKEAFEHAIQYRT